jgi:hypothetical protein
LVREVFLSSLFGPEPGVSGRYAASAAHLR